MFFNKHLDLVVQDTGASPVAQWQMPGRDTGSAGQIPDQEDPLEKDTAAIQYSCLESIPWTERFEWATIYRAAKEVGPEYEVTEHTCTCTRYNLRNIGLKDKELQKERENSHEQSLFLAAGILGGFMNKKTKADIEK